MDKNIVDSIHASHTGSEEERLTFPAIVGQLAAAGVERYHTDFCRWEKTYFMANGESLALPCKTIAATLEIAFSPTGVESAVRASQAQRIKYHEFCKRAMAAGCVGYIVSLAGQRVVYYGRTAESHIEHFPRSKP